MAFVNDTFSGGSTVLSSHTGETGATWTQHASGAVNLFVTTAGRVITHTTFAQSIYYASGVPASPDYLVEADIYIASVDSSSALGVCGRLSTSANTYYHARHAKSLDAWQLYKFVAGTSTQLGTNYSQVLAAGNSYRVGLDMNDTTVRLLVDGVERISVVDSSITAAGRAGLRLYAAVTAESTGSQFDNFTATDAVVSGGPDAGVARTLLGVG